MKYIVKDLYASNCETEKKQKLMKLIIQLIHKQIKKDNRTFVG